VVVSVYDYSEDAPQYIAIVPARKEKTAFSDSIFEPVNQSLRPVAHPLRPAAQSLASVDESLKPMDDSLKPMDDSLKPMDESLRPADELLKPMTQLLKPVDESLASKIRPLEREISLNALFFNNSACFAENEAVSGIVADRK
jgi:hypothetical protein